MLYYHGTNKKFDYFNADMFGVGMGGPTYPVICITPRKEYAEECARSVAKSQGGTPYVYTVKIKTDTSGDDEVGTCNVSVSSGDAITILKIEDIS